MGNSLFNPTKSIIYENSHNYEGELDPKIKGFFLVFFMYPAMNFSQKGYSEPNTKKEVERFISILTPNVFNKFEVGVSIMEPSLSNDCESITFPDLSITSEATNTTLQQDKYMMPLVFGNESGATFTNKFRGRSGFQTFRLISAWYYYMKKVTRGIIHPLKEHIDNMIIDYKGSVYFFILKPDLSTIELYGKYTGIYPANLPLSSFNEEITSVTDVASDYEFNYDFLEFYDSKIIEEFNRFSPLKEFQITKENASTPYYKFRNRIPVNRHSSEMQGGFKYSSMDEQFKLHKKIER
jgi:hypothetical protein